MNDSKPEISRKRKYQEVDADKEINHDKLTKISNDIKENVDNEDENAESTEEESISEIDDQDELPIILKPFHMKKFREKLRENDFIHGKYQTFFSTSKT